MEESQGLATPLTDDEIDDYVPFSAEEVDETVRALESLGLRM